MNLTNSKKLGSGAYGTVFRVDDIDGTGQTVAVKQIRITDPSDGAPKSALREISLLKLLSWSPRVIQLTDVKRINDEKLGPALMLILKFYEKGDLRGLMTDSAPQPLPLGTVKRFLHMICEGLYHFQAFGVIHRDLKPDNILVEDDASSVVIADFGLSKAYTLPEKVHTPEVVTRYYRAPELLLGSDQYSAAVDVWSVACILAELASGEILFAGANCHDQLVKIVGLLGTPTEEEWPGISSMEGWIDFIHGKSSTFLKQKSKDLGSRLPTLNHEGLDLLSKMLQLNPEARISIREVLQHPFFECMPFSEPISIFKKGDSRLQLNLEGSFDAQLLEKWTKSVHEIMFYGVDQFDPQPVHRAIYLLLSFVLSGSFELDDMKAAHWCCFHLACKFELLKYEKTLTTFSRILEYTSDEVMMNMEEKILIALGYGIGEATILNLLDILRGVCVSEAGFPVAECELYYTYIAHYVMTDLRIMGRYPPSLLSSSIMFIARFLVGVQPWTEEFISLTGHTIPQMRTCIITVQTWLSGAGACGILEVFYPDIPAINVQRITSLDIPVEQLQ